MGCSGSKHVLESNLTNKKLEIKKEEIEVKSEAQVQEVVKEEQKLLRTVNLEEENSFQKDNDSIPENVFEPEPESTNEKETHIESNILEEEIKHEDPEVKSDLIELKPNDASETDSVEFQKSQEILKMLKEIKANNANDAIENELKLKNIIEKNKELADKYSLSRRNITKLKGKDENIMLKICELRLRNKKFTVETHLLLEKKQEGQRIFMDEITQIIRDERQNASQVKESINKHRHLIGKKLTLEEEIKRKANEIEYLNKELDSRKLDLRKTMKRRFVLEKAIEMKEKEKIIKEHVFKIISRNIKELRKEIFEFKPIIYFQATFYKIEKEIEDAFRQSFGEKVFTKFYFSIKKRIKGQLSHF